MKKYILFIPSLLLGAALPTQAAAQDDTFCQNICVYDSVTFYDGYLMDKNPDKDLDDGILRHSCSLYSRPLTEDQLNAIGDSLKLNVSVHACCDNYDRIGNINIAFVPKGEVSYSTSDVDRIEIARFITPFMDKNKKPDTVPYNYDISYLSPILRDSTLRADYDLWLEYELFGVPYAANTQIEGCAGRNDVFKGSLEFETSTPPAKPTKGNLLIPIVIKRPEYVASNLNNYNESGTDTIGKTVKSYFFTVPEDVEGAQIVLITSNHGANEGGEEYNRRWHYVYIDGELALSYIPGRETCEPFRKYNTQANGIYGWFKKSDAAWQSFSNWCPGDVIDNRIIWLDKVKKGEHKVTISVPDAVFNGQQGDIPVSMYFHAALEGTAQAGISLPESAPAKAKVMLENGELYVWSDSSILSLELYTASGQRVCSRVSNAVIAVDGYTPGLYLVNINFAGGITETHKVIIR